MGNTISYEATECFLELPHQEGHLKGLQFDDKSRRYAGIPYAQPPLGDLRWRRPQPLTRPFVCSSAEDTFDATKFGPVCPQASYSSTVSEHTPKHAYSEDCLRLNIWTPVPSGDLSEANWPVVVWFHGGWFQVGDPSQEVAMDPTELISSGGLNAIFVAVGYRLNVFGFLACSALREEAGRNEVGNYGLWDQRMASDWVYKNIAAFGGDPGNITLAGRSAGAYSVQAQCLYDFRGGMPDTERGRFRRLLMISNAIPTQPKTVDECESQFEELCEHLGIPFSLPVPEKLRTLRQVSSKLLCDTLMTLKHHTFRPITDGDFIQPGMFQYYREGSFAQEFRKRDLRLYIGEVLNEDTLYAVTNSPQPNRTSLMQSIDNYYPNRTTNRLLQHYALPQSEDRQKWQALYGQIIADGQVRAPSRFLVNNLLEHGVDISRVWRYMIAHRLSFITAQQAPLSFGVTHAMDRPIWNYSITHGPTEQEQRLMRDWIQDLGAFVKGQEAHDFGTAKGDEYKVMTSDLQIEIQEDGRWQELLRLMQHVALGELYPDSSIQTSQTASFNSQQAQTLIEA